MKKFKALLITTIVTALSIIPVLADLTGITPTSTTTSVTTTITEIEYLIGDIDNSGSIDLTDAQLSLKAALKIITLSSSAAKAADVNYDGFVDLTDAQITLKLALHIMSVDNLYQKPDYLDLFITAMNSEDLQLENHSADDFLSLYSHSHEITNEQLTGLAQNYDGIIVCSREDLHQQGLLSIPANEPLDWYFTIPNGVLITFKGAKKLNNQITITWGITHGGINGVGYDSTFEIKNGKWILTDSKQAWIS